MDGSTAPSGPGPISSDDVPICVCGDIVPRFETYCDTCQWLYEDRPLENT